MAFPVAVERGFITRDQAVERLLKIVNFLGCKADKFHGAFPHWLNGTTGKAIPFSPKDNGGDIVETALLLQGLLTVKEYFNGEDPRETRTKNGMALIATKAQADILPAYIWRKNNRFKLFRRTYIILGDVIPYESLGYDTEANGEYARITSIAFDKICSIGEEFERSREEAKKAKKK